eukprot:Pompholyxophrys_punicea_v1_NODE_430_length_1986_cov_6.927536.p4 type:complete len:105 gc:universal NODE_430_length_1986_cov_6.927536:1570-1256(-)
MKTVVEYCTKYGKTDVLLWKICMRIWAKMKQIKNTVSDLILLSFELLWPFFHDQKLHIARCYLSKFCLCRPNLPLRPMCEIITMELELKSIARSFCRTKRDLMN